MIKGKNETEPLYEIKASHMHAGIVPKNNEYSYKNDYDMQVSLDGVPPQGEKDNTFANESMRQKIDKLSDIVTKQQNIIDKTIIQNSRPFRTGLAQQTHHSHNFNAYLRKGVLDMNTPLSSKSSLKEEGVVLTQNAEEGINEILENISPIRSIASKQQINGASFNKLAMPVLPKAGWVGEKAPRPQLGNNEIIELKFPTAELYAMPMATQSMLDDAAIDIESWLAREVSSVFAEQETQAFISGTGTNMPKGFLSYPQVDVGKGSWGKIEVFKTGVSGDFSPTNSSDILLELIYALKPSYRSYAHFIMNRRTLAIIRKMKDANGSYLLQQDSSEHPHLFGYKIIECEEMPDIKDNEVAIAFGNFQRGYLITDRLDTHVLRDPFTAKPYVLFYTTKRVGGGVQDFDAIKLLKFS